MPSDSSELYAAETRYTTQKSTLFMTACVLQGSEVQYGMDSSTLRLATYNIRFDNPTDPFPWQARRQGLANLLLELNADVFGLQEVLAHQLSDLGQALPPYAYVGVGRGPNPDQHAPYTARSGEHNPIFFRTKRFQLLDHGTFWLSPTPDIPGSQFERTSFPRIATWAELEDRASQQNFFVFNTHFPYEQDAGGEAARAFSAKVLLEGITQIAGDADTVIMGDFNLTTHHEPDRLETYDLIREQFQDALEVAQKRQGPEETFFGFEVTNAGEYRIDYIFAHPSFSVLTYETVLAHNRTHYYSDHAPVVCDISFS